MRKYLKRTNEQMEQIVKNINTHVENGKTKTEALKIEGIASSSLHDYLRRNNHKDVPIENEPKINFHHINEQKTITPKINTQKCVVILCSIDNIGKILRSL